MQRLLSRSEAATYCGVSVQFFERICPISPLRLGESARTDRFDIQDLDKWLDRMKQGTQTLYSTEEDWGEACNAAEDQRREGQRR